jgi:hypothetical protein
MTTEAPAAESATTSAPETTPVETPESDFMSRFEQFKQSGGVPAPALAPAPEPEPEPEPKPEPAPKPTKKVTGTPLDDVEPEKGDDEFNLPLGEDDEEPPVDDKEELPSNIKEGTPQAVAFRALRKEKQEIARQRDAYQTELEQIKARSTELEGERTIREELEAKVKEYEAKLAITRIEESPVYQKAVMEPYSKIADATEKFATQYGVALRDLDKVFDIADDTKRKEGFKILLSGLDIDPEDQLEIRALAKEYRSITAKREEILSNSEKTLAELEAIQKEQNEREAAIKAEERRGTTKQVAEYLTRKLPVLKSLEGFDYDKASEEVAETDLSSLDAPNQAYNAIAGKALPKVTRAYRAALAQVEQLTDELEKIRRSAPSPGRSMPVPPGGSNQPVEGESVVERFKKTFGG